VTDLPRLGCLYARFLLLAASASLPYFRTLARYKLTEQTSVTEGPFMPTKSEALPMAWFGGLTGVIGVALGWLIGSLIVWDFSLSATTIRTMIVFGFIGLSIGYIGAKWHGI
jgi:hypothetical protein